MNVLGIDLSLTGTGLGVLSLDDGFEPRSPHLYLAHRSFAAELRNTGRLRHFCGWRIQPSTKETQGRWEEILGAVLGVASQCDAIAIEGYAYGANLPGATEIRELGGIVRFHLAQIGKTLRDIAPSTLKKFTTGHGHSEKNIVLKEIYRRYGLDVDDDNVADAFGLALMESALRDADNNAQTFPGWQFEIIENIRNPKPKIRRKKTRG